MCGILGLINPRREDGNSFERALALLSHRGPEHSEVKNLGPVVLGHRRLSIQDLSSAGNQPMSNSDQTVWIVFNGEIYNFKELQLELLQLGCEFKSGSDTEVILQGYITWGWPQLLERLLGDFALAIYDQGLQRVVLARDHIGKKPLYFSENGTEFIFASEIKAIASYIGRRPLNRFTSLNPILMTGLAPPGTTMFEGIQEVEPGCSLEYDLRTATLQKHRYFHVSDLVSKDLYDELSDASLTEVIAKFSEAMEESVARHLISDAKLGVMFSAGLDSSLITAMALKTGNSKLALFHFISDLLDTEAYATKFESNVGGELKPLRFNERDLIYDMPRMVYNYETVNKEEGTVLGKVCAAAHQDGYKVLLTGDGADELFGGYRTHKSFYTRSKINNSRVLRLAMRFMQRVFPGIDHSGDLPRGTDYFMFPSGLNFLEGPMNLLFHQGSRLDGWTKCLETYDFLNDSTERETSAYLLDDINYWIQRFMIRADRIGMMESVELRIPFLYLPIIKLAVNTPIKWRAGSTTMFRRPDFLSPFNEKKLVKEMALKYSVPKDIVYRKKIGTPFDVGPQMRKLSENFPLTNVAEFFETSEKQVRNTLLHSFDPDIARLQWSILATEVLIREFVHGDDHESISDEFRAVLN